MAWRIHENLIEGEMDNTTPGRVTGTMRFVGLAEPVRLDLSGDFKGDIHARRIRFQNPSPQERNRSGALGRIRSGSYMQRFADVQTGEAGTITADCSGLYVEWYSEANGRVVLELPATAWSIAD